MKPIIINPRFGDVEEDLHFIASEYFPNYKVRRFSVDKGQSSRLYKKIFDALNYQDWDITQEPLLQQHLCDLASIILEPRFLFDSGVEFLARLNVAIPKYSVLQRLVGAVINTEKTRILNVLNKTMNLVLSKSLEAMFSNDSTIKLRDLRRRPKNI